MKAYRFFLPSRLFAGGFDAAGNAIGVEAGSYLPANGAWDAPQFVAGHWPRRTADGSAWESVEDHRGEEGYLDGEPHTIRDCGPLPDGWSATPPPPTLEEVLAAKLSEVMGGYTASFAAVEKIYPAHEREGWPLQEAEALALQADPAAPTPVLSALVQLRGKGESVADLAAQVLANAATWRGVYAWYTGQQQRMYAEVSALTTVAEVQAYQVVYAQPAAQG